MHQKRKFNVILVGYGRMGRNHERVLREHGGFEVTAIVDPNADLSDAAAKNIPIYKSVAEVVLAKPAAHIAVIATPTSQHLACVQGLSALKIPLFVEKPAAPTLQDSQKMVAVAREAGIKIFVGHTERSNPAVNKLFEVIRAGIIGTPIHYSATRVGGFPSERAGSNVLLDLAVHDLDVITRFAGPFKVRSSICHHTYEYNQPDTAQLLLTNDAGASASIHVNWITPTKIRTLRVTGTGGVARVDYILQTCKVAGGNLIAKVDRKDFNFHDIVSDYQNIDQIEFGVNKVEPLLVQAGEIHEFLSVGQCKLCGIEEASQIINLAEMAITMGHGGMQGAQRSV